MAIWFQENYTPNVNLQIKIKTPLHSEVSPFQKIDFFDTFEFGRIFTLDDVLMVTEKDEFIYHEMIVHVPLAVHPNVKKVLVVGGGDGGTVRELTKYPSIEQIDLVEIDERVVRLCQQFIPQTASQLEDPRVHMFFEDGVAYMARMKSVYDLIIVDSTDPIGPGEGLFSNAFYRDCYEALNESGILINQHESPFYEAEKIAMEKAHAKLKSKFPIAKVYQFHVPTYPSGYWLFGFASKKYDPIQDHDPSSWEKRGLRTQYYNSDIHRATFALPNFVKELLENA